ncbi:hypothetical protein LY44_00877 [Rhodobacter capsulatus]|nr:hypothetical protein AP073_00325 [Rhodobacter capsulatus]KQB17523.1 hypothetical protein AP071_00330 [Rhodobacter capsulatus]PZX27501.1 hypothetical protein LY44_00877 [Rhodobacter capsulatus]
MGRMFKAIFVLLLTAVLGTLGYAYFGDMQADPVEIRSPVALPDLAPAPAPAAASPAAPAQTSPAPQAPAQPAPATEAAGAGLDD